MRAVHARPSPSSPSALRSALALAAFGSAAAATWLLGTCATVLPARDPAHVPLWLGVALGMLALAGVSAARAAGRARGAFARLAQLGLALAALAFGVRAAAPQLTAGRHGEGYLLVLGGLLAAHGAIAVIDLARDRAPDGAPVPSGNAR